MKKARSVFKYTTLLLLYATFGFILIFPISKYELYLPGNINEIKEEIVIDNKNNYNEFYSVYIITKKNPTPFQLLVGKLNKSTDILLARERSSDSLKRGLVLEELSYQRSLINAYNKASLIDELIFIDYELEGYMVTYSQNDNLVVGDLILAINSINITTFSLEQLLTYLKNNDNINLTLKRDNKETYTTITKNEEELFGISIEEYFKIINSYPKYNTFYDKDLIGGPSGGLMQTLSIYSSLLEYKFNLKFAGTGTINIDGTVGPIGGIKQKILTVNKKIDVFFVPKVHYDEALLTYQSIKNPTFKLIEVETFDQAVEVLQGYL